MFGRSAAARSLQRDVIGVGCILRLRFNPYEIHREVPCEWNSLVNHRNVNETLHRCPSNCHQDEEGQRHPIVVLKINDDSILYVAVSDPKGFNIILSLISTR